MRTEDGYIINKCLNGDSSAFGFLVEEYDPVTDKWSKKADMPTPRVYLSASEANGRLYVIGGFDAAKNVALSAVEEYSPETSGQSINFKGKLPTTWGELRTALGR